MNNEKAKKLLQVKEIINDSLIFFKKNDLVKSYVLIENLFLAKKLLENEFNDLLEKVDSIILTIQKCETPLRTNFTRLIDKIDELLNDFTNDLEIKNKKPLYVITPTGDRHPALKLATKMMNRQTLKPDMWIIVDDGKQDPKLDDIDCNYKLIRCKPIEHVSIVRNIRECLYNVPSDNCKVVIWEDDDYYPIEYLSYINDKLNEYNFVCSRNLWYYHVGTRLYYNKITRKDNCSLHSFSMTGSCLQHFCDSVDSMNPRHMFVDLNFFNYIKNKSNINCFFNDEKFLIHITGMFYNRKGQIILI